MPHQGYYYAHSSATLRFLELVPQPNFIMKIFLSPLGLFVLVLANPLAIWHPVHAAFAPIAGVVGGRDIQNGDMTQRSDNSLSQVVRAIDNNIKRTPQEDVEARQIGEAIDIIDAVINLVNDIINIANEDDAVWKREIYSK